MNHNKLGLLALIPVPLECKLHIHHQHQVYEALKAKGKYIIFHCK